MILYCTQKLRKEMKIPDSQMAPVPGSNDSFARWFAHLFFFERKKCLMFTHAESRYSFVVPGVSRKDIQDIRPLFRKELSRNLYYQGFSAVQMRVLLDGVDHLVLARSKDRSVLASMNQLIYLFKVQCGNPFAPYADEGIVGRNRDLAEVPCSYQGLGRRKYIKPLEELKLFADSRPAKTSEPDFEVVRDSP